MKPMGSLYEFMELQVIPGLTDLRKQSKSVGYSSNLSTSQFPPGIILNYSMPNNPKARAKTNVDVDNYKPMLKRSIKKHETANNDSQVGTDAWKQLIGRYKMNKYYHQERINSLLPKKIRVIELQAKNRLNIDQSLLRALEKIKVNEERSGNYEYSQEIKSQHVSSLVNHADTLSKLRALPFQNIYSQKNITNNVSDEGHKQVIKVKKSRSSLSDTKRIEFQRCLSWSKKHHKDGKYYKKELGKAEPEQKEDWSHQVKKRKNLLSILGQKYNNSHNQEILNRSMNPNRQSVTSSRLLLRESRGRCENHERRESIAEALKDKEMKKRQTEKSKTRPRALTRVDQLNQVLGDLKDGSIKRGKSIS